MSNVPLRIWVAEIIMAVLQKNRRNLAEKSPGRGPGPVETGQERLVLGDPLGALRGRWENEIEGASDWARCLDQVLPHLHRVAERSGRRFSDRARRQDGHVGREDRIRQVGKFE